MLPISSRTQPKNIPPQFKHAIPDPSKIEKIYLDTLQTNELPENSIYFLPIKRADGTFEVLPIFIMNNEELLKKAIPLKHKNVYKNLDEHLSLLKEIAEYQNAIKEAQKELVQLKQEREQIAKRLNELRSVLKKNNKIRLNRLE
jgi:hypothetical protein